MHGPAAFIVRRRRWLLAAAAAVTAWVAPGVLELRIGYSVESFLRTRSPELKRALAHYERFPLPDTLLFFGIPVAKPYAPASLAALARFERRLRRIPGIARTLTVRSAPGLAGASGERLAARLARSRLARGLLVAEPDGNRPGAYAGLVQLRPETRNHSGRKRVLDAIRRLAAASPPLVPGARDLGLRLLGIPVLRHHYVEHVKADQRLFLPLGAFLTSILLLVLVRSLAFFLAILSLVPLTLALTFGLLGRLGAELTLFTSTLPTLLMVIAVADAVHQAMRARELVLEGLPLEEAAARALRETFFPCLLTSVTTAIGFGSLVPAEIPDLADFGRFAALGVGLAFVLTAAVLPGLVVVLVRLLGPGRARGGGPAARLAACAVRLGRLPVKPVLAFFAGLSLIAALLAARVEQDSYLTEDLWEDSPYLADLHWFEARFAQPQVGEILAEPAAPGADWRDPRLRARLARLLDEVERIPGVGRTLSILDALADGLPEAALPLLAEPPLGLISRDGRTARVLVFVGDIGARAIRRYLDSVRALGARDPAIRLRPAGIQLLANHQVLTLIDEIELSFAAAFILISLLLTAVHRSLRLGLIGILPNLFPLLATLGFMGLAGIRLRIVVVVTFAISFGLAVDNTIHVLSRYRRERAAGAPAGESLARALSVVGAAVWTTSFLLLAGFATTLFSHFRATFDFGRLACLTILAALAGDLVLLPALLRRFAGGSGPDVGAEEEQREGEGRAAPNAPAELRGRDVPAGPQAHA